MSTTARIFVISCFLLCAERLLSQTTKGDSLKRVLIYAKEDTNKVHNLNELSWQYTTVGEYDSALQIANVALKTAETLRFKKGIANSYNMIGLLAYYHGHYPDALKNYTEALKIALALGNKKNIASCYNNIGNVYADQGNYPDALKAYFTSLKIREQINDRINVAKSYNNIGTVYFDQGNYDEALRNYEFTLKIRQELNEKKGIADVLVNIGNVYFQQEKYDKVLENNFAALKVMQETGDQLGMGRIYNNVGAVYQNHEKPDEAIRYYRMALEIREKIEDYNGIAASLVSIGAVLLEQKKHGEARPVLKRGLEISEEIGAKDHARNAHLYLSTLDSAQGNYKSSFYHYKLFVAYRDSLTSEENTKKIVQQQMQYDFDKKSTADSIKNAEAKRIEEINHKLQIRNQKLYTYAGLGGFLVMLVIAGISFVAFRNKKKANLEIALQKHLVEEKQKEILDSIYYARRIQRALITNEKYIERKLKILRNS